MFLYFFYNHLSTENVRAFFLSIKRKITFAPNFNQYTYENNKKSNAVTWAGSTYVRMQ